MQSHEKSLTTAPLATATAAVASTVVVQPCPTVESRPAVSNALIGAFFILLGVLGSWGMSTAPMAEPHSRWVLTLMMPVILGLPGAALTLWQLRTRIVADSVGLRWRSMGNWRRARWEEVTDYHHLTHPDGSAIRWQVETEAGNLAFAQGYPGADQLQQAIQERAVFGRARSWGKKGIRVEDPWPRTFSYNFRQERASLWFMGSLIGVCVILQALWLVPLTTSTASDLGWPMALAQLITGLAVMLVLFAGILLVTVPAVKETGRRRNDRITVDQNGIRFTGQEREVSARWEEITDYHVAPAAALKKSGSSYVVTTRNGTFEFIPTLVSWLELRELIQRKATSAATNRWTEDAEERLGNDEQCWSGKHPGVGQRVFHFRTRSNRVGLLFLASLWLTCLVSAVFGPLGEWWGKMPVYPGGMIGVTTALTLWSYWRYRSAAILVDEYGLTQRTWNGERFIRWEEIQGLSLGGSDSPTLATVKGKAQTIRFWLSTADATELRDEISQRAINVPGGWKVGGGG